MSEEEDASDAILRALQTPGRLKSGAFPKKFTFSEVGDAIAGRISQVTKNFFNPEKDQYFVESLKDHTEYSLPSNLVLNRLLKDGGAKVGDFAFVRYQGDVASEKEGRNPTKLFEAAVMSQAEAEMLMKGKPLGAAILAAQAPPPAGLAAQEGPKKEATPAKTPTTPGSKKPDPAAVSTAHSVVDFYQRMGKKDLQEHMSGLGFTEPIDIIIPAAGLKVVKDGEQEFVTLASKQ